MEKVEGTKYGIGNVDGKCPTQIPKIIREDYGSGKSGVVVTGVDSHENRNVVETLNRKEEDKPFPNNSMGLGQGMESPGQDMNQ